MTTNNDTITLDSTVDLDDSSVMSSTKNSSVLEVTSNSVVDISTDTSSSETEGDDEEDVTANSTSENVDSTSERLVRESSKEFSTTGFNSEAEEEAGEATAWVTSNQSLATESTVNREGDSVNSPDQSSILSATQLLTDISSNQATKDESSIIGDLTKELANNNMKLSESVVEGLGENAKVGGTIDDLSNELANKIKIISELKESSINANSTINTGATNRSIIENVDKSIEETFRDKSIAKSFGEVTKEEDEEISFNDTDPGSPHKRKARKWTVADTSIGSVEDVEDTMTLSSSSVTEMPAKRQRTENPDLPSTCQVLLSANTGAKVYLVGTAHFSKESCEDVRSVIQAVQPDIVVIELCKARTNLLQLDEETILEEAQSLNLDKSLEIIRSQGTVQGVMYLLLLSMSAHLTKELGMAPGGEFRTAYQEAQKLSGCIVQLGDRPINITLKRAIGSLGPWQKMKLAWNILTNNDPITKEDVERCKDRDLLHDMLAEMAGEYPALASVFVDERDIFLAHSLQMAADAIPAHALNTSGRVINDFNPPTVVGVVGIGHMPGIVKKWGTVTQDQVRAVVKVEPPSLLARAAVFTVKSLVWGGCLYGAYKVFRGPVSRMLIVR